MFGTVFSVLAYLVVFLHTEGLVEEQWREVTRMFNDAGIDGFELNFSCPHGLPERNGRAKTPVTDRLIHPFQKAVCLHAVKQSCHDSPDASPGWRQPNHSFLKDG